MFKFKGFLKEEQIQKVIGILLRSGVLLSAGITLIGGIVYLFQYGNANPGYHVFKGEPADLRTVSGVIKDLFSFRSRGIIQFGLLLLMATPVARVAFSIFVFVLLRDTVYIAVTLIVLTTLTFSIAGGGW